MNLADTERVLRSLAKVTYVAKGHSCNQRVSIDVVTADTSGRRYPNPLFQVRIARPHCPKWSRTDIIGTGFTLALATKTASRKYASRLAPASTKHPGPPSEETDP